MSKDGLVSAGEAVASLANEDSVLGILVRLMQVVPADKIRQETDMLCDLPISQMRERAREIVRRYAQ